MAITHFSILSLPDENIIDSKINGSPIALNTLYPIASQNGLSFVRTADFASLSVFGVFTWKAINQVDNIESNVSNGVMSWKNLNSLEPASANYTNTITNNDTVNLLNVLTFNEAVENFKIKTISGPGTLKHKNNLVFEGQQFLIQDLYYLNYTPEITGGGNPYFSLTFEIGKDNIIDKTRSYTLVLNIDSLAEITNEPEVITNYDDEYDNNGSTVTYNTINQFFKVHFNKAFANSDINLQININSPWLSLNGYNKIEITNGFDFIEKTANEVFNITVKTDSLGVAQLDLNNIIVEDTADPKQGDVTLTIIDVNGDTNLVSTTNQVVLNTNL